jgi:hypothetical protein
VLVAYNAGPGMANKYKAAGDDPSVLPSETKKYLQNAAKMLNVGNPNAVTVTIINNTGGNAIATVGQLPN